MKSPFLWQNGEVVTNFSISLPRDRKASGFWLGDGIFETFLVENGAIFAKKRHQARLVAAAKKLAIKSSWLEVSRDSAMDSPMDSGLDLAVKWLGEQTGQIRVSLLSSGDCLIASRTHEIPESSLRVTLYPYPKNQDSILAGVKTLSYGENAHSLRYAQEKGFDDVLFLNQRGEVSESALANLLLFDGSRWWTPPLSSGALPGVTRELLIAHFEVGERTISQRDLVEMKAMALTSSLRDIQAISKFEEHSYLALNEVDRLRRDFQAWRRAKVDA
ncbi:MAG: aminotransferase class IV [Candidatus Nanopelagicaceae bacterium]